VSVNERVYRFQLLMLRVAFMTHNSQLAVECSTSSSDVPMSCVLSVVLA